MAKRKEQPQRVNNCQLCRNKLRLIFSCCGFETIWHCERCGTLRVDLKNGPSWREPTLTHTHPDFMQPPDCNPNPEPLDWRQLDDEPLPEDPRA